MSSRHRCLQLVKHWENAETLYDYAYEINDHSLWAMQNVIATEHLSGRGDRPTDQDKLVADLLAFDAIKDDLHLIPSSGKLDQRSRCWPSSSS